MSLRNVALKWCAAVALLGLCGGVSPAVTIEWVTVGDAGNLPDTEVMTTDGTTGYGSVDYAYRIGKYEVTNAQYREFLNAVAKTDPHGLYNKHMAYTDTRPGGIDRLGTSGSYTYVSNDNDPNWDSKPVNWVSFKDALRFANWLHNGQPTGPQDASTTEDGAYDMSLDALATRKPGATVFLPSEDEWYKAAFYKGGGIDGGYWDYATQSDTVPNNNPPEQDTGNSANYDFAVGPPYYSTDVDAYGQSVGPYGTFNQNANVDEWNEAFIIDQWGRWRRGLRGGSAFWPADYLPASDRGNGNPSFEAVSIGFRVATVVPEPRATTMLLGLLISVFLTGYWRKGPG